MPQSKVATFESKINENENCVDWSRSKGMYHGPFELLEHCIDRFVHPEIVMRAGTTQGLTSIATIRSWQLITNLIN